jgi:hypothetical protein
VARKRVEIFVSRDHSKINGMVVNHNSKLWWPAVAVSVQDVTIRIPSAFSKVYEPYKKASDQIEDVQLQYSLGVESATQNVQNLNRICENLRYNSVNRIWINLGYDCNRWVKNYNTFNEMIPLLKSAGIVYGVKYPDHVDKWIGHHDGKRWCTTFPSSVHRYDRVQDRSTKMFGVLGAVETYSTHKLG